MMLKKIALVGSTVGMLLSAACSQSDSGITTAVKAKFAADDEVKAYESAHRGRKTILNKIAQLQG
jgi:hypothetical protein